MAITLSDCIQLMVGLHVREQRKHENLKAFVKTDGFIPEPNNQGRIDPTKGIQRWVGREGRELN